jgi:hypothetical protein
MTTHDYQKSAKLKAAILKEKREQAKKHIFFLKGYIEAWDKAFETDTSEEFRSGASTLYVAYCKLHDLPIMSADELICELNKI